MKRLVGVTFAALAALFLGGRTADAWDVNGRVICPGNGLPLGGVVVNVVGTGESSAGFSGSATTGTDGSYFIDLLDFQASYRVTLDLSGVGGTIISPGPFVDFELTEWPNVRITIDWLVDSPACQELRCWLTGGGTKFNIYTGGYVAEHGPQVNFGGNVNPSCSPDPGEGGQWNHVDHGRKLHFQGTAIEVVACGNVDGIPPGSTSPPTPFNFIEFQGTGTLKGITGNKTDFGTVCFFGRAEDRNEPGSGGQKDGELKDRYFLEVTDCAGNTLLFLDENGDPATVDPVTITGGNLQIHVSSCPTP
jgi:hypothetical protein